MNIETMKATLKAQGLDDALIDSMLKSFKPKKDKSAARKAYFAGQSKSKKVSKDIECIMICECCGYTETTIKHVECVNEDSPDKQRLPMSNCPNCVPYFTAMTHEQLVSLAIAAHNPSIRNSNMSTRAQVKLAKELSPTDMLNFTVKHH